MEAICSFGNWAASEVQSIYEPEDHTLHNYPCENLKLNISRVLEMNVTSQ
jgi:hypothetical protein